MASVFPRCVIGDIEPFISVDGRYFPCCWLGNKPTCDRLRDFLGERLWSQLDIRHNDLDEIQSSDALRKLERSWFTGEFAPCAYICGQPYDPDESSNRDTHIVSSFDHDALNID